MTDKESELRCVIAVLRSRCRDLEKSLARCRDAMPIPLGSGELEWHWSAAMNDVDAVAEYVELSAASSAKDAERYQWLRINDPNRVMYVNTNERINKYFAVELDDEIDREIKKSK